MGQVMVVTSGKGGVGKTTAAANLGVALAAQHQHVVLVDMDMGLRNLDVALGLENRIVYDLVDVIEGTWPLTRALIVDRAHPGLALLPAPVSLRKGGITPYEIMELVAELRGRYDWVIIDCPAGIDRGFRNAIAGADRALVVTVPEVSAVRDALRVVEILREVQLPMQLMINRFRPRMVRAGSMMDLDAILSILDAELLGIVCEDTRVVSGNNLGRPAVDESGVASAAFRRMAKRLMGAQIPIRDPSRSRPLLAALDALRRVSG